MQHGQAVHLTASRESRLLLARSAIVQANLGGAQSSQPMIPSSGTRLGTAQHGQAVHLTANRESRLLLARSAIAQANLGGAQSPPTSTSTSTTSTNRTPHRDE